MSKVRKSLLEIQFPIAQLSLESYKERKSGASQFLNSLGKWWGSKPLVLIRALILGALFESSEDPDQWQRDLSIFLKLMCLDDAGMWKRKTKPLPASLCYPHATDDEKFLFTDMHTWARRQKAADRDVRARLERRVFYTLSHEQQRAFCCRVEEIDGPADECWEDINSYCHTNANSLQQWVEQRSQQQFGRRLKVGDAFAGMGSIPFEAACLGCDVYAADLNPVAGLLAWSAINVLGAEEDFHDRISLHQSILYDNMNDWLLQEGIETSAEGWRSTFHLYCLEIKVPEWDDWIIPLAPSWEVDTLLGAWVELIPDQARKRFDFVVRYHGQGLEEAKNGTKQGADVSCPQALWEILHRQGKTQNAARSIKLSTLLEHHGGLRHWEKSDYLDREGDFYRERLYCIRWRQFAEFDNGGDEISPESLVYRSPDSHDLECEAKIQKKLRECLSEWQSEGYLPDWKIRDGEKTRELIRTRGWTYWHHLFTPRQLLILGEYSRRLCDYEPHLRMSLMLGLGKAADYNCRLCHWLPSDSGAIGGSKQNFYNQAFNTFYNFPVRSWLQLHPQLCTKHRRINIGTGQVQVLVGDARETCTTADLWITDPPYADAVNYEELSEFFLAWYKSHLQSCFPNWYIDSKRDHAVRGDDAPFRIAMAECYAKLAEQMSDDGIQVLMFTHKDTDVWEDLAMIMWAAGLQVKQVWSVATETSGAGIRVGNFVQATYNMILRKRPRKAPMGFVDLVIPQINDRVKEVITHMRASQVEAGSLSCGYTDTDYLLAAQAVAAEVVTGFSSIDGIDLEEELRTPNKSRDNSVLRDMMNQAKRTAVDFLVPVGLEEHLRHSPDGNSAYQFWRTLCPEEKFLLKSLELEANGAEKIGTFQDLGRAYGIVDYEALLGPVVANNTRSKLPTELPRPDLTSWVDVSAGARDLFSHCVTRHLYHALQLLAGGAESERAVKHLVDCTDFWEERRNKHQVILGYVYQTTESIEAWNEIRPLVQMLRLAVENHRA
jgi:putative DNA methylase